MVISKSTDRRMILSPPDRMTTMSPTAGLRMTISMASGRMMKVSTTSDRRMATGPTTGRWMTQVVGIGG
jgi:hypothetical protein